MAASMINCACGFIFIIYSVLYIAIEQRDIMALNLFLNSDADGDLHPVVAAMLATTLFLVPAALILKFLTFPIRLKFLVWLPSFIALGFQVSLRVEDGNSTGIPYLLTILMIILTSIAIVFGCIYKDNASEKGSIQSYLTYNISGIIVCLLVCNIIANTDTGLHRQLRMARQLYMGEYSDRKPDYSTDMNRSMTAICSVVLSQNGKLPENLFEIPNLDGSSSLFPDTTDIDRLYRTQDIINRHLGCAPAPKGGMSAGKYLQKALDVKKERVADSTSTTRDTIVYRRLVDYYLCSLLLDRKLVEFVHSVPEFYIVNDSMPRYYREAIVLARHRQHIAIQEDQTEYHKYRDEVTETNFQEFMKIYTSYRENANKQRKWCYEMYGDSYWYYFFFQKKKDLFQK